MQPYLIAIIAVVSVIAALLILLFVFALISENFAFGKRCDKNSYLKYFTADDFGLSAQPVEPAKGLKGFIYSKQGLPEKNKIIIFSHGMGPGHIAYTTEIAYFCNLGYNVLAVDSRGCNYSDGKNIKGMYSGVETVISAIDYIRGNQNYNNYDIFLVGHSWGAYSVLCASAKRKVSAVVSISAPVSPSKAIKDGSAAILSKPLAAMLSPFWAVAEFFKYGAKGNANAAKSAVKSKTPTLIIHGENDKIVYPENSVYQFANGDHITKLLVNGKAHNPYNTENAEKLLAEVFVKLKSGDKDFNTFDFKGATEEDGQVMQTIADFLTNA